MKISLRYGTHFTVYLLAIVLFLGSLGWFLLWTVENGIPLIEGNKRITEGARYGFSIGQSREKCYATIVKKYSKRDHIISVEGQHNFEIAGLGAMPDILSEVEIWKIKMPASWSNSIRLDFVSDTLYEIWRSRWLYERP